MWRMKPWVIWTALPFIILGLVFLVLGYQADPAAKTDDGYSLKWFWYIMGAWFIGLTVLVYAGIFYFVGAFGREGREDARDGPARRGHRPLLRALPVSELNNMPQIDMELRVDVEGKPTYGVTHREYVNPVNLPALQKGSQVPVLVDPQDPDKLILDWQ